MREIVLDDLFDPEVLLIVWCPVAIWLDRSDSITIAPRSRRDETGVR